MSHYHLVVPDATVPGDGRDAARTAAVGAAAAAAAVVVVAVDGAGGGGDHTKTAGEYGWDSA